MSADEVNKIKELLDSSHSIVIIQADNPDGDSLASALALEQILGDMGKTPHLYCAVDIPDYLKHLSGWDRVNKEMPASFDASIIVDTSAIALLEKLEKSEARNWVASKPVIVIDHHTDVACDIPYATIVINDHEAVATGEAIYKLIKDLGWSLNLQAKTHIVSSILADSLGLASEGTTPQTYRIVADLIEEGVDRPALEEARRAFMKMDPAIFKYKAKLIERTEIALDGRLAIVSVPQEEITSYSPLYNPAALIIGEMLLIDNVQAAIVFKLYKDGKITAAFKSNRGGAIGDQLASYFGGGGHPYASGFKITSGKTFDEIKAQTIAKCEELLNNLSVSTNENL